MNLAQRLPCLLVVLVLLIGHLFGRSSATEPEDEAAYIRMLIEDLDSGSFAAREHAASLLMLQDKALPALREAIRAKPSLEQQWRLKLIVYRSEQRLQDKVFASLVGPVQGVDQFADFMVHRKGFADDRNWEAAWRLAQAMVKRAAQEGGQKLPALGDEFLKLPVAAGPPERAFNAKSRFLFSGVEDVNIIRNCFLISSGPVKDLNWTENSILFVNGDLAHCNRTHDCVIFCNGNITNLDTTYRCVIFCTGRVERMSSVSDCVVFAGGAFVDAGSTSDSLLQVSSVKIVTSSGNRYLGLKEIEARSSKDDAFGEADHASLYPLRLFDLGRLGIEVAALNGGVVVNRVEAGKTFARAGLRREDKIMAIDGQPITTVEDVKRLLRRKDPADMAELQLRRGLETLTITAGFSSEK